MNSYSEFLKSLSKNSKALAQQYCKDEKINAGLISQCKEPNPFPVGVTAFYSLYCGRPCNWNTYEKMLKFFEEKKVVLRVEKEYSYYVFGSEDAIGELESYDEDWTALAISEEYREDFMIESAAFEKNGSHSGVLNKLEQYGSYSQISKKEFDAIKEYV